MRGTQCAQTFVSFVVFFCFVFFFCFFLQQRTCQRYFFFFRLLLNDARTRSEIKKKKSNSIIFSRVTRFPGADTVPLRLANLYSSLYPGGFIFIYVKAFYVPFSVSPKITFVCFVLTLARILCHVYLARTAGI